MVPACLKGPSTICPPRRARESAPQEKKRLRAVGKKAKSFRLFFSVPIISSLSLKLPVAQASKGTPFYNPMILGLVRSCTLGYVQHIWRLRRFG